VEENGISFVEENGPAREPRQKEMKRAAQCTDRRSA